MLKGSFKSLWNKAVFFVGIVWLALVYLVWNSGQLETAGDRSVFIAVVIGGFVLVYVSGFLIESRHRKKQAGE
ncbi:hypothetical protein CHL67_01215 [Prosthecochloris sp. GSB1]|uniref:hypothetical protein n=1 Tax=Prosthecochloris sp. GSB1 TaxID=281093 RepID=UPI000B8D1B77|nr:hypothetical protein [Prosthecochloris sp. GSB1]ASQ89722.1 hypothetical protein CHL67_01215 [Prosthecochloris sp. GSB1]